MYTRKVKNKNQKTTKTGFHLTRLKQTKQKNLTAQVTFQWKADSTALMNEATDENIILFAYPFPESLSGREKSHCKQFDNQNPGIEGIGRKDGVGRWN